MAKKLDPREFFYVPAEDVTKPTGHECITNSWFVEHPEKGLLCFISGREARPQCNRCETTAQRLTGAMYPGHQLRFLPVAFTSHFNKAMRDHKEALQRC